MFDCGIDEVLGAKYVVFDGFIGMVLHEFHMLMCGSVENNIGAIFACNL